MSDDGRLSAPGHLLVGEPASADDAEAAELWDVPLAQLAAEHGLRPSAERPPVFRYIRELWRRSAFIGAFATARNIAMYTEARLGQLWQERPSLDATDWLP